jgi:hypothetical protein
MAANRLGMKQVVENVGSSSEQTQAFKKTNVTTRIQLWEQKAKGS